MAAQQNQTTGRAASHFILIPGLFETVAQSADGTVKRFL